LEKNAREKMTKVNNSEKVTVSMQRIVKMQNEVPTLHRTFPKGDHLVIKGYVLQVKTVQPNGKLILRPIGRVVHTPVEEPK